MGLADGARPLLLALSGSCARPALSPLLPAAARASARRARYLFNV